MLRDFISLIYPNICLACGNGLSKAEESICISCIYNMPRTNFHREKENLVFNKFKGRALIQAAASYCFFNKESKVQRLLHQIKYKGQQQLALKIGVLYGEELKQEEAFNSIDVIVPVPLHQHKKIRRGFNQSEAFAEGLSSVMEKPLHDALERISKTETQTKRKRFGRWTNVETAFRLKNNSFLTNKHVLLVDDVVTTGSTLDACIQQILPLEGTRVSIATIACA
jgi:ComF family protein